MCHKAGQVGQVMPDMPGSAAPHSTTMHWLLVYLGIIIHTYLKVSVQTKNKQITLWYRIFGAICVRPVVPGGAGGAMAPPNFGRSVKTISTKGGRLCPPNNTGTPGSSDIATALQQQY